MPTCLIADEAPVIRKVAARILEQAGFDSDGVTTVGDLEGAVASSAPSLIIIAESFDGADCAELVGLLRASPNGRDATIVVCSAQNSLGLRSRVRRAGGNGVLLKPFTGETIRHQLRSFGMTGSLAA